MMKRSETEFLRDYIIYIVIGVAVLVLGFLMALYVPSGRIPRVRWFGFVGFTAITFGYTLREYRPYRRGKPFWLVFCGCLAVHLVVFTVVLLRVEKWPLILFGIITPIEAGLLQLILVKAEKPRRIPQNKEILSKAHGDKRPS